MVEAHENAELVNLTRTTQHERDVEPQVTPPPPSPGLDAFAAALSQEIATARGASTETSASSSIPADTARTNTIQAEKDTPRDTSSDSFRQTRLAVTAGLVLLLIVVWILQKRKSLP